MKEQGLRSVKEIMSELHTTVDHKRPALWLVLANGELSVLGVQPKDLRTIADKLFRK
jgi:hypothetical protein